MDVNRVVFMKLNNELMLGFQDNLAILFAHHVSELIIHVHCTTELLKA